MRDLLKGVLKTGSGAAGNILLGMLSIKIMAVVLGPAGTGLYSLIRQTIVTFTSLGAGGQTALVQGVVSKSGNERDSYIRSVFWLFVLAASFSLILIESFAPSIAGMVFGENKPDYVSLVRWMALPVLLMHAYIFSKGVLNGYRAIGRLALIEMVGPLITLFLVYPISVYAGEGYALAFVWMISAALLAMWWASYLFLRKQRWTPKLTIDAGIIIAREDINYFLTIAGTVFLVSIISTGALLAVRAIIATVGGGLAKVGLFDLAWSLSGSYVALLLASFGTYYTPTLGQMTKKADRAMLITRVIRLSTMLMIPLIVTVVALKPLLVSLLYSSEYMASLETVRWMLIGDYLKITSWVLAIPAIVNADMRIYFWTETFWYLGFVILSVISIVYLGELQGIGIAFILQYLVLVIYYLQYVRRVYEIRIDRDLYLLWLTGLAIVIIASAQNWNSSVTDWMSALLWIVGSLGMVIALLKKSERQMILSRLRLK